MQKAFIHHNKRLKGREMGNISQYFRKRANGNEAWSQWEKVLTHWVIVKPPTFSYVLI